MAQDFSKNVFENYENYKEQSITRRNFRHSEILPLIEKLKKNKIFSVSKIGQSVEDRDIFLIKAGHGQTSILLWSQMHGDESTATMALFDIFNFFSANDQFNELRKELLDNLTIYFIPMLNPDGAERFQRRNALEIDINRDAARLESPESRILKSTRDSLNPLFGFNLHDQSPRYSAGGCFRSASISFLAPPVSYEKEVNPVRERAMKLIVELNRVLSEFIPGHVGKYSDDFEPRAFGDNIQRWGTSTILIETGGWKHDLQKQFLRKINFTILLSAFKSIAVNSYTRHSIKHYYSIPDNKENIFDLLIRNIKLQINGIYYKTDIGINRYETIDGNKSICYSGIIEDMGDLSTFSGYEEYLSDDPGFEAVMGEIYPEVFEDYQDLAKVNFEELLKKGFTTVLVKNGLPKEIFPTYPISIKSFANSTNTDEIKTGSAANFLLKERGKIKYAVINGFVYNLSTSTNSILNTTVVR